MARTPIDGVAVVDKPAGWTSHDVVARLRTTLGERRIGHAGTLDPDATGVLLVGVGRVTRLLRFLTALPKEYAGEVVLGVETSTLDAGGDVVATHDMGGITLDDVRGAAQGFVGEIDQVPPMVSAVKVGGRRLHELAREGQEVERAARRVRVDRFDVEPAPSGATGVFRIDVACSSGTYVRVLAADVGRALGGGAHLRNLRRTAIGSFTEAEASSLEEITPAMLVAPAEALRDYPRVRVESEMVVDVGHGKVLPHDRLGVDGEGPWAVVDDAGDLIAVYERHRQGTVKPSVVLAAR
ncbi:MAG: tRNA pseudouridine(55) synthase TruB [Acidimicrobiales bacterium]